MRKLKTLKRVKDRFSLFNDGRKIGANKRKYIVQAVQKMIQSAQTQELLRVGEAYGYYGHQPRQRAKKLELGETEVIMINGRPVVVENVPSNRTISISCSDDGIVEHEEEFFDTETGRIALSLWESGAGGWSWATGGRDTPNASITNSYHGMDYVKHPNFLSLDHPAMMMENAGSDAMFLESLQGNGFDANEAQSILDSMNHAMYVDNTVDLENQIMYLESINDELRQQVDSQTQSTDMLLEAVEALPVYMTDAQRHAFTNLNTPEALQTVKAFFESIGNKQGQTLPTAMFEAAKISKQAARPDRGLMQHAVNFGSPSLKFPK